MKHIPTQEEIDHLYKITRETPTQEKQTDWVAPFPYNLIHLKDKLISAFGEK